MERLTDQQKNQLRDFLRAYKSELFAREIDQAAVSANGLIGLLEDDLGQCEPLNSQRA